jgi:hypothetical protein
MTKLVHFNYEHRPFIYIQFQDIPITDENFEEYKREYLELLLTCKKQKDKIIPIIDINYLPILPIPYMMKQTKMNKELFQIHKKYLYRVYIYCKNKIFQEMINMYMFVEKTAVPIHICSSFEKIDESILKEQNITFHSSIFIKTKQEEEV